MSNPFLDSSSMIEPPFTPAGHKLVATYQYVDEQGEPLSLKARFEAPDGSKSFLQWRWQDGQWVSGLSDTPRVLYRLLDLQNPKRQGHIVYVPEGEKDVETLRRLGKLAVCAPGGASGWSDAYSAALRGRRVAVLIDNDDPGRRRGAEIHSSLQSVAKSVVILRAAVGNDVSDHVAAGRSLDELVRVEPVDLPPISPTPSSNRPPSFAEIIEMTRAVRRGKGWMGYCPVHEDSTPSLAIDHGDKQECIVYCHAGCDKAAVLRALRLLGADRDPTTGPYFRLGNSVMRQGFRRDVQLSNFFITLVEERLIDDGQSRVRELVLFGTHEDGTVTPSCVISAERYQTMRWMLDEWGAKWIVFPGAHDHLRAAVSAMNAHVPERVLYAHLGWRKLDDWCFLTSSGAICASGRSEAAQVAVPDRLSAYDLPAPVSGAALRRSFDASLRLLRIARLDTMLVLYAAVWRSVLGEALPSTTAVVVVGRTGSRKSTSVGVAMGHFGIGFSEERMPANFESTANALARIQSDAKDVLLPVDDLVPGSSDYERRQLERIFDRITRGPANQADRARLTAEAQHQRSYTPRAFTIITAEELIGRPSAQARSIIVKFEPDEVDDLKLLSRCQRDRGKGLHAGLMATYLQWLAPRMDDLKSWLRTQHETFRQALLRESFEHTRTAGNIAHLLVGLDLFLEFARDRGLIDHVRRNRMWKRWYAALVRVGHAQSQLLRVSDPATVFIDTIAAGLASGAAHLESRSGGAPEPSRAIDPLDRPLMFGWRRRAGVDDHWRPQGQHIGWIERDTIYLDPDTSIAFARKVAHGAGQPLSLGKDALMNALRESGALETHDPGRSTTRIRVNGRQARVLALGIDALGISPNRLDEPGAELSISNPSDA